MLYKIPRFYSARSFQIKANIETSNALIRKLMDRFVQRSSQSKNPHYYNSSHIRS